MELNFECVDSGRWYVDLPEYEGNRENLELVESAAETLYCSVVD